MFKASHDTLIILSDVILYTLLILFADRLHVLMVDVLIVAGLNTEAFKLEAFKVEAVSVVVTIFAGLKLLALSVLKFPVET